MKQKLQTLLFALVAIMMPIGAWAQAQQQYEVRLYSGVATFYRPMDVQLVGGDTKAYVVTDVIINEDGSVQLVEKELTDNNIPAFTAVILRNDENENTAILNVTSELKPIEEANLLKGTLVPMALDVSPETGNFALYGDVSDDWLSIADWQAHPNNGSWTYTLGAYKAYLQLPVESWSSKIAELKALPHLQHTHGSCEICGQETEAPEASWGSSADALTSYGTLAEAFEAACTYDEENETYISSEIRYIQLQSDVTSESSYFVYAGTFTLDLNGKTLQSSTTTLNINGGNVTFTDGSEKQTGKVATTSEGEITVCVGSGNPTITIMGGQYEAVNREALEICSGSVTIRGGEFTTAGFDQIVSVIDSEEANPSLTIMGGTFVAQNVNQIIYMDGNTTISGGTFVGCNITTVWYIGGTLSFVATEATDETPGFSPMGLRVHYNAEASIVLPDGYRIYNENEEPQSELMTDEVYYIGKTDVFSFTVTFDPNNGKENVYSSTCYSYIRRYTLPECSSFTVPDGKMFAGWQVGDDENNLYQPGERITVTANTVVKAVWKTPYTVSFDANGGGGVIDAIQTPSNVTLPECTFTAPDGKMFKAWQVDGAEYQPYEMITVSADTEVKAVWAVPYIVSFDANGGEGDMDAIGTLFDVTLPECTFTAPDGKMFKAWQVGGAEYQPYEMITVSADTEVKAVWTVYVPQIVIKMYDTACDSWNGNAIVVKQNGEVVDTATIIEKRAAATAKFDYDASCEYSFYWDLPELKEGSTSWPQECSFEIYVEGELVFAATTDDCAGFEDNQRLHTIAVSTISEVSIADGSTLTEYSNSQNLCVGTLTYTRTLPNLKWNALYVPFEIPVSELLDNYDVAYFNDVHSFDNDDNGEIDDLKMEVIKITTGTLKANYPYLIRAKNEEAMAMSLVLTDASLYATEENTVTCSSVFMKFDVTGTYSQMSSEDLKGSLVITSDGSWKQLAESSVLRPFRLYLTMTAIDGSPVKVSEQAARSMRIVARGESEGTTSIDNGQWTMDNEPAVIYDLMGRRVLEPQKGGVYVVDGKKVVW